MIASGSVGEHLFLKIWRYLLLMKISEHHLLCGQSRRKLLSSWELQYEMIQFWIGDAPTRPMKKGIYVK